MLEAFSSPLGLPGTSGGACGAGVSVVQVIIRPRPFSKFSFSLFFLIEKKKLENRNINTVT